MGLYEHWPYTNFHELNLDILLNKMQELEAEMTVIRNWYEEWEGNLAELQAKYAEISALYETLEQDFIKFKQDTQADINLRFLAITNDINTMKQELDAEYNAFRSYVEARLTVFSTQVTALDQKLDTAIENFSQSITMINPFTGAEAPLTEIIYLLASFHMTDAITAGEYDSLNLTAAAYDALGLTAYEYDVNGRTHLMP